MDVVALIATIPRIEELLVTSLPSVLSQTKLPDAVFIVQDNYVLTEEQARKAKAILSPLPVYLLSNSGARGAAGSWNTGIKYISQRYSDCYVAILDDDDSWLPNHLQLCLSRSNQSSSDLVLSGIEACKAGKKVECLMPNNLHANDFLVGNPGWQGSNTFIRL